MNNLYGWAMSEYLPYGDLMWLKKIDGFDANLISEKSPIEYFLKVDLEYPDELHELHNDYLLAPEKRALSSNMLSNYCKKIANKYEIKVGDLRKLIPNLSNKTNYIVHYRNLQLYLSLGMKLTKIHRVLKSKQSEWMKKYINFNTEERMNVANDFEKDFLKLMINSVYGKTMENLRKRINVRLVNNAEDFLKYTSKPTCITQKKFGKDYAIKLVLILNEPIYVGLTVLDLSKWKMYDFHYNFIIKFFDADSLTSEVKSEYVYEKFLGENICLTLVIIQKIQSFLMTLIKKLLKK